MFISNTGSNKGGAYISIGESTYLIFSCSTSSIGQPEASDIHTIHSDLISLHDSSIYESEQIVFSNN